jgi:hypothetical protein
LGDHLSELLRRDHFGLVAVAEDPPHNFAQPGDTDFVVERTVGLEFELLRFVPEDLGYVLSHKWFEMDLDVIVRAVAGDQLPGISHMAFEAETAGNAKFDLQHL